MVEHKDEIIRLLKEVGTDLDDHAQWDSSRKLYSVIECLEREYANIHIYPRTSKGLARVK